MRGDTPKSHIKETAGFLEALAPRRKGDQLVALTASRR